MVRAGADFCAADDAYRGGPVVPWSTARTPATVRPSVYEEQEER